MSADKKEEGTQPTSERPLEEIDQNIKGTEEEMSAAEKNVHKAQMELQKQQRQLVGLRHKHTSLYYEKGDHSSTQDVLQEAEEKAAAKEARIAEEQYPETLLEMQKTADELIDQITNGNIWDANAFQKYYNTAEGYAVFLNFMNKFKNKPEVQELKKRILAAAKEQLSHKKAPYSGFAHQMTTDLEGARVFLGKLLGVDINNEEGQREVEEMIDELWKDDPIK